MIMNDFVHLWLCESRFISFIMTPATIANQVDKYILMKLVSVPMCYTYSHQCSLGIISIHVDNRHFKTFRKVTCKVCGAIILRLCRKTELIIHDYMNRTPYCI